MQTTPNFQIPYLVLTDKAARIPEQSQLVAEFLDSKLQDGTLRGPQGLPGVNAVPADEAIAAYLEASGTATNTAAYAVVAGALQPGQATRAQLDAAYCKKNLVVDARDYGVSPESAGNKTALNNALTAAGNAGGGTVIIPPGLINIEGWVFIPANVHIVAYGAHIRRTGIFAFIRNMNTTDTTTPAYDGPGNITIEGGIWDSQGDVLNSAYANCFNIAHAKNVTFRNMTVRNVAGAHGIEFHGSRDCLVENVRFEGYVDTGGRSFSEAVQFDQATGYGLRDNSPCINITVRDCYVGPSKELGSFARAFGSHTNYGSGNIVHQFINILDNFAEDCTSMGIRAFGWSNSRIEGNTILNKTGGSAAIQVRSPDDGSGANVSDLMVRNNIIYNCGGDGIEVQHDGRKYFSRITIEGNQVILATGYGIQVAGSLTNARVISNTIYAAGNYGVYFSAGVGRSSIKGNDIGGKSTMSGVYVTSTCSGVWVDGNDLRTSAGLYNGSAGAITGTNPGA